jgi:hypothetical protein
MGTSFLRKTAMKVIDPGHIYEVDFLDPPWWKKMLGLKVRIVFRKRSSAMIKHSKEHDGINTQELMRICIDLLKVAKNRTEYLYWIQTCNETADAVTFLEMAAGDVRNALYMYEARAYRRKRAKLNKQAGKHDDDGLVNVSRTGFKDFPLQDAEDIENMPVGEDGHLLFGVTLDER